MAETSECKINLTAIQLVDPTITDIFDNSTQTALYKFSQELMNWERTSIEGTFFLYKRKKTPPHGYIILNRLNTTNKVESLCDITDIQLKTPYFLYKNRSGDIYGIWFYKEKDCVRIVGHIGRIINLSEEMKRRYQRQRCVSESESHSKKSKSKSSGSSDILALLAHAQMEYDKKSSTSSSIENNPLQQSNQNGQENPHSATNGHGVNGLARQDSGQMDETLPRKRFLSSGHMSVDLNRDKALLARWLSGPESVDTNGQPSDDFQLPRSRAVSLCIEGSKKHSAFLCDKEKEHFKSAADTSERWLSKGLTSSNLCCVSKSSYSKMPSQIMTPDMFEETVPKHSVFKELFPSEGSKNCFTSAIFPSVEGLKDSLISSIAQSTVSVNTVHQPTETLLSPQDFQGQNTSGGSVSSRALFQNGNTVCDERLLSKKLLSPIINKDQLRDSLIYMLNNDSDMLSRIHEAYISSLRTHFNNFKK